MPVPKEAEALLARKDAATRIAVVGASNDPSKYGHTIVTDLASRGYAVLPVNPKEATIAGLSAFASPADVPDPVSIWNFVVPPKVTLGVLQGLDPERAGVVWLQPGSFDPGVLAFARGRYRHVIEGDCIMVVSRWA